MKRIYFLGILFTVLVLNSKAQIEKEVFNGDFTGVRCKGTATYKLVPADTNKVIVFTDDEEVFDFIDIGVKGHMLVIDLTDKNVNVSKLFEKVVVKVFFKELDHVVMEGAGKLESVGPIISPQIVADLRGTGKLEIEVECDVLEAAMRGTSVFTATGKADNVIVRVEGVGGFFGKHLEAGVVDVKVDGVGNATVNASNELKAPVNGVGSIKYLGSPEEKDFDINGVGSIKAYEE